MTLYAGRRDVAERLLARDPHGDIAVEGERAKAPVWHLSVSEQVASSPIGLVARHHFDLSQHEDDDHAEWVVANECAERLAEVLAHNDAAGLVALVAQKINTEIKEK